MVDTWPSPACINSYDLVISSCTPCPDEGDNCSNAFVVTDLGATYVGNTCDFCDDGFDHPSKDVVYYVEFTEDYYGSISLCGSTFDTYLELYADDCATMVAYNDDYCGVQSQLDFCDTPLPAGNYFIVVEGWGSYCGDYILTFPSCPTEVAPVDLALADNYPNPFNPTTTIDFSIAEPTDVSLVVYNINGEVVANLVDGEMSVGNHSVTFDASNLSSGVYFYTLRAGDFVATKKMTLIK
jgi:hypothetical protein